MPDLNERVLDLFARGDDVTIAALQLVIELADLGRTDLGREVGNLMSSERTPGHLDFEDIDSGLIFVLAQQISPQELKCWGRLFWQILSAGDRDLLHRAESLMRQRISN